MLNLPAFHAAAADLRVNRRPQQPAQFDAGGDGFVDASEPAPQRRPGET